MLAAVLRGDRSRIIAGGMVTTVLNRGIYALVPLLAVPIGLHHLGAQGFGAWVTALSVASMVGFADFGIGTGLMTRLGAGTEGNRPSERASVEVSSAYGLVMIVATFLMVVLIGSSTFVNWARILNAKGQESDVQTIVVITLSSFVCNIVVSLIVRVQYGVGQQARANLWQAAGNASMIAGVYGVAAFHLGDRAAFVLIASYAPVVIGMVNTVCFFGFSSIGKEISPSRALVSTSEMRSIFGLGRRFVVISLLMTATTAVDPWIVARTVDLSSVPNYVIPYRVFALIGSVCVLIAMPLWPLHARAVANGEDAWIRRITVRMTIACGTLAAVASAMACVAGPAIIHRWLGQPDITFGATLWIGLALWWSAQTIASPAFMVQNGAAVLGPQTFGYVISLLAIPAKWYAGAHWGYQYIPWVGLAFYCLVVWPFCYRGYQMSLSKAVERGNLTGSDQTDLATPPLGRHLAPSIPSPIEDA